jgi:pimeloyl-ACP methyl ester carboxylesterase
MTQSAAVLNDVVRAVRARLGGCLAMSGRYSSAVPRFGCGRRALLPGNPEGAAAGFADGFDMTDALASPEALYQEFEPLLCEWDRAQWNDPGHPQAMLADMREALKSGPWGGAWDNVAWIGAWDVDPTTVRCPVLLWYGSEDRMAPPEHARWLDENLPDARLVMWEGEGHLLAFAHLAEMLRELLT